MLFHWDAVEDPWAYRTQSIPSSHSGLKRPIPAVPGPTVGPTEGVRRLVLTHGIPSGGDETGRSAGDERLGGAKAGQRAGGEV